jgi:hypothetical protein
MPGRFTNISNSGRAIFSNVSNSGRGYFFNSNTTSTTTTTTTLGPQEWYALEECYNTSNVVYSISYNVGTFNINDIVVAYGVFYFRVKEILVSNPGGSYPISATGLTSCPTTTTTTTTAPPLTITNSAVTCSGTQGSFTSTFSGGSGNYVTAALDTNQSTLITLINSGTGGSVDSRIVYLTTGATSQEWTSVANGTWYVAVKDSNSAFVFQATGVVVNCTTTSTTTTTTTSTPTTKYSYSATACTTGGTVTIISDTILSIGSTYSTTSSGIGQCYTILSSLGTTTDSATGTYYLISGDCTNNERCAQL